MASAAQSSATALGAYPNGNQQVIADPLRPIIYLAHPDGNNVQFIDATTATVTADIVVGNGPVSLDLSLDDASLLVAVSQDAKIVYVGIAQATVSRSLALNFTPVSVRDGRTDRLYVSSSDGTIRVLNATTGMEIARSTNFIFTTILEVSGDGSTLLATTVGTSPVMIAKFDIRGDTPVYVDTDNHDLGSNFQQEAVDWVGDTMYLASGAPYGLEMVSLSTLDRLGLLPMDSYPQAVVLAADRSTVYGLNSNSDGATLAPWIPTANERGCSSPSRIEAQLIRGLPDTEVDQASLYLDGTALPAEVTVLVTPYETYHLIGADTPALLAGGSHTVNAAVLWNGKAIRVNWTFSIDYAAGSPTCPYVQPGSPGQGAIVDLSPTYIDAAVWHGDPVVLIESVSMTLQGQPRAASLISDDRFRMNLDSALPDGVYEVTAQISWRGGSAATAWNFTVDTDYSVPRIPLVMHADPAGFALPVPAGWTLREDVRVGNETVNLLVFGPSINGFQESLAVKTEPDPSVQETHEYLLHLMQGTIEQVQTSYPEAILSGSPEYRTVAGHSAVRFVVAYGTTSLSQNIAVVVSETDGRFWILIMTSWGSDTPILNTTFRQILDGFQMTLGGPTGPFSVGAAAAILLVVLGAIGVSVAVVVFVLLYRRLPSREAARLIASAAESCPRCGSPVGSTDRFCPRCGNSLGRPPPG